MPEITCFKAYDVRGRVPDQLNEDIARRIGRAFAEVVKPQQGVVTPQQGVVKPQQGVVKPQQVVVGHDIRLTSEAIKGALIQGLLEQGVNVFDIGLCGTEEIYFATSHANMDGGIAVTASHNPKDYNGMKFVREQSKPISGDTGLLDIKALAEHDEFVPATKPGKLRTLDTSAAYIEHLLSYVDVANLKPLKIVVDAGNGGAGRVVDLLEPHLPFEFIKLHHEPDGNFPNGVPNPLLPENREDAIAAVREHNADLGLGWDGDFDRCFFFDENGEFVEGYYVVGLLAEAFLQQHGPAKIVHDPRLTWNTVDIVESLHGEAVQSKTGHAFIKERMRLENAIYGGEMSAHHYFRDFAYCDSGMIPWLLVTGLICEREQSLSEMVTKRMAAYPCSGEINRTIEEPAAVLARVEQEYSQQAELVERVDGLSMSMGDWRFNLRLSNTEPVVRLNVESRGNQTLMEEKTSELLALIDA